jgi:NADH-quinone oxidoreductase subunit L
MTVPLIILAVFSLGIGWGPEFWRADGSLLSQTLAKAQPASVKLTFAQAVHAAHENHLVAGLLALAAALTGAATAFAFYGLNKYDPDAIRSRFAPLHRFLLMKWHFDELYDALFVVPVVQLAFAVGRFDKYSVKPEAAEEADRRVDPTSVDGLLSALGLLLLALGKQLRAVQSGLLRRYILLLVLTTVLMFAILSFFA